MGVVNSMGLGIGIKISVPGFVIFVLLAQTQTRLKGTVRTPENDQLIAREMVTIDGGGSYTTDDVGQFDFDIVQNLKIGQPARFHVYHVNPAVKVKQWIVIRPCDLTNGRKDSLPDIGAEPISLMVLPRGDPRLKSLNAHYSILGCTIEEVAAQFQPASAVTPRERSSLFRDSAYILATDSGFEKRKTVMSGGVSGAVEAAFHVHDRHLEPALMSVENVSHFGKIDDVALAGKAEELGFTLKEFSEAIDTWAKSVQDDYERGLVAFYEGRYAEASQYILRSIPSPPGEFLKRYVPLARAEYEQGHYSAAESALRKVLAVHSDDPMILNNLGLILGTEAKYVEAELLCKRALAMVEKALGPDHPDVATALGNLALLYYLQAKYGEAEPLYKRALTIDEKALGPNRPDVARILDNLAVLYRSQGRYKEAEPLYKRALAIDETTLGTDHPILATHLNNLAVMYYSQGNYGEAEPLYERALAIDEKALGPDHPAVATALNNLALLYESQGEYWEAEPLYKRALAIAETTFGPSHPDVATALGNLALLYYLQAKYAEAESLYKRALAIDETTLGADHPLLATDLNNLALLYSSQGKYGEAEPLYERALAIVEKALGPDHLDVANVLNNLAELCYSQGKYGEAEPLYKRALAIVEKALGPDRAGVATIATNLARTLRKLHRDVEAKTYEDQAARIRSQL